MGLKETYKFVADALLGANEELGRAATVGETIEHLPAERREVLEEEYAKSLSNSLARILPRLVDRGYAYSPGKQSSRRYYCSTELNWVDSRSDDELLPNTRSKRQQVKALVREAAERLGRAVRVADLKEEAERPETSCSVEPKMVSILASDLHQSGDLQVIDKVPGDGGGRKLYLPVDFEPEDYRPEGPLTWLGEVQAVFGDLWAEEQDEAVREDRQPRPLSTGDVRARLRREQPDHPRLEDPQLLVNALRQLAHGEEPALRTVDRAKDYKHLLWVPAGVEDDEVDVGAAWATDSERLEEATERAKERAGQPAVPLEKIKEEIQEDSTLKPESDAPLYRLIGDVTKEALDAGSGNRQQRVDQRIWKVGKVGGHAYYSTGDPEVARAFVRYRDLREQWSSLNVYDRFSSLQGAKLRGAAVGRARLLEREVAALLENLRDIERKGVLPENWNLQLVELRDRASSALDEVRNWLNDVDTSGLPADVDERIPAWTPAQLKKALAPVYPRAERGSPAELVRGISHQIRRVPNPEFQSRRSGEHRTATEYLFDRAEALMHAAFRWGDEEARVQATVARDELGRLRDARFLVPHVTARTVEQRFHAVACLAVLGGDRATAALEQAVEEDPSETVRKAAARGRRFVDSESLQVADPGPETGAAASSDGTSPTADAA